MSPHPVDGDAEHATYNLLRAAAALVYVADLATPELSDTDAHHLGRVLRLRSGEAVIACDGAGSYRECRFVGAGGPRSPGAGAGRASLEVSSEIAVGGRVGPRIGVGFSLAKGERTSWAVAKLAELGVDDIMPVICQRTIAVPGKQGGGRNDRLQRIAHESAMQARRLWLPKVSKPGPLRDAVALVGEDRAALAEPGGARVSLAKPFVFIGPEGGFAPSELALGLPTVGLGNTILRIETAAVAAGTLLSALRYGAI